MGSVIGVAVHPPCVVPDLEAVAGLPCGANLPAPQLGMVVVSAFDDFDRGDTAVRIKRITAVRVHKDADTLTAAREAVRHPDHRPGAPIVCTIPDSDFSFADGSHACHNGSRRRE